MTRRLACPPAPGPLEDDAAQFDDLFETLAQRRGFRTSLQGVLLPRERNKTLTALVGAEPGPRGASARSIPTSSGSNSSCPNRPGTPRRSTPDAWNCSAPIPRLSPTTVGSS